MPLQRAGPDKPGLPYALLFNAEGDRLVVLDSRGEHALSV
jgi:hypothetical protein